MTEKMMKKIEEAKKMVSATFGNDYFMPSMYEDARYDWEEATPTWVTLKKYAIEAGLKSEEKAFEWHSDGSLLAEMCSIKEGEIFYHTVYHF